jgi:hypothetical protein
MTFDINAFRQPAMKSDVASVAIDLSLALAHIDTALIKIGASYKVDLSEETKAIEEARDSLHKQFQELAGWNQDAG